MDGPPGSQRNRSRILELLIQVPAGYVTTHSDIGHHLGVAARFVGSTMAMLTERERRNAPWWRVVADGGAIGRHRWRDLQMDRLRHDGVTVSPAGIVQELLERRIIDLSHPPSAPLPPADGLPLPVTKPARSRGMLGKPKSSL